MKHVSDTGPYREWMENDHLRFLYIIYVLYHDNTWNYELLIDEDHDKTQVVLFAKDSGRVMMRCSLETAVAFLDSLDPGDYFLFNVECEIFEHVKKNMKVTVEEPCIQYVLDPERFEPQTNHELELLVSEDAKVIDDNWHLMDNHEWFFRQRIENGQVMGVKQDGELIGWMGTYLETDKHSLFGYLHVMPGHRRSGVARSIISGMVERSLDSGRIPVSNVITDNMASRKLTESMGFVDTGRVGWIGVTKQ